MTDGNKLADRLIEAFGGHDDPSTVDRFLDTGYPPFNFALSARWDGGLPVGRMVEIAGPPSSGKTAISTAAMSAAQKQGCMAIFMDHERSFDFNLAERLGLNTKAGPFVYRKPRTFEDSLDLAKHMARFVRKEKLIDANAPICVVFDSLASMVPKSALDDSKTGKEKDASERSMHDNTALARATSAAFPAFSQWCEELDVCALFLNQTRQNIGVMYGDSTVTPGGNSPKFYFSVRVMLSAKKMNKSQSDKTVVGSQITAHVTKNKVSRPFLSAEWLFRFEDDGSGRFDVEYSLVNFLLRENLLQRNGNWIVFDGNKYHPGPLAEKIRKEGRLNELLDMLPGAYEPEQSVPDAAE